MEEFPDFGQLHFIRLGYNGSSCILLFALIVGYIIILITSPSTLAPTDSNVLIIFVTHQLVLTANEFEAQNCILVYLKYESVKR